MKRNYLKLYRGISADEFNLGSIEIFRANKRTWKKIIEQRVIGDFSYPHGLDKEIKTLHEKLRLEYQYFTDSRPIAESYAKKVGGLLVEITVPLKSIIDYFDIEFQNFSRRKKLFEIVYCVKGSILFKHSKSWRIKVRRKK